LEAADFLSKESREGNRRRIFQIGPDNLEPEARQYQKSGRTVP
jgi:hypothetical protein